MKRIIPASVLVAICVLAACSMPNYVPAHGQSEEETAAARLDCKMVSEGMTPPQTGGFVAASGKPAFVGGVMGGYAAGLLIGAAVQQEHRIELYDDCMVAHGFRKEEPQAVATASAPVSAPPVPVAATPLQPITVAQTYTVPSQPRAALNIRATEITPTFAQEVGLYPLRGVWISDVEWAGAGRASGIEPRDVILAVNGTPVNTDAEVSRALYGLTAGSKVVVTVWRNHAQKDLIVTF